MFENIKTIRPHFHSLREIKNFVSLDIKLPLNWSYENIVSPYTSISVKLQQKDEKQNLISLISEATQGGYDVVFACANEIIKINKEDEEKQKLFQEKVRELQDLFKKESLDKLKDINLLNNYGQENTTGVGLVEKGNREGQDGFGDTEESDD